MRRDDGDFFTLKEADSLGDFSSATLTIHGQCEYWSDANLQRSADSCTRWVALHQPGQRAER